MTNLSDTQRFLQAVFPDFPAHAIFADTSPGGTGWRQTRSLASLDGTSDCYLSIAAFPDDGRTSRTKDKALEVRALVIDDVGTKVPEGLVDMALGRPTRAVLTSAGNQQWWYRLTSPVPKDDWDGFFAGVAALIGGVLDGPDAVHVFRLPLGVNTKGADGKLGGGGTFKVRVVEENDQVEVDPSSIPHAPVRPSTRPGPSGGGTESLDRLRALMALLPNEPTLDRTVWVDVGHGLKALCENDADGLTVFDEWSATWTGVGRNGKGYDPEHTRDKWASFGASSGGLKTAGGKLRAMIEVADPAGFRAWVFDDGVEPPPPDAEPRAGVKFIRGKKSKASPEGVVLSMMENAKRAVAGLGLVCRYDEFHHRACITRPSGAVERVDDKLVLMLRDEITRVYGKEFGLIHVGEAIMTLAYLNGFNPVREMLDEAEAGWDGVKRLDRLGPDYFHTEDTPLSRECFRRVMIAAVRRARSPGVKFDQILVLESPEGWDKSTAWRVLAGDENFSDADILSKDAKAVQEELADIWIHEIADLAGLSRADVDHVKSFASRMNDRARPAYGRFLLDQPRQSIEVGTTNAEAYLASTTGNRRFWTFKLRARVDVAALMRDRLALWGEAARAESAGETLVLSSALWGAAAVAQEDRRVVDPWEDELANLPDALIKSVGGVETVTNVAIHDYLGGHRGGHLNSAAGRKIAEIMKRLGWERTNKIKDAVGKEVRGYSRGTVSRASVLSSVPKNPF